MICLQTITRFKIASMIPADGEVSFAEIAAQIDGLSEQMVCRLLRHAMTLRVFREPTPGMVAHTRASKALTNPIMNAWLRNGSHEMWPAAVKVCWCACVHTLDVNLDTCSTTPTVHGPLPGADVKLTIHLVDAGRSSKMARLF